MRLTPSYPVHAVFYGPARPTAQIWRLLVGLIAGSALFLLMSQIYLQAIEASLSPAVPSLLDDLVRGDTVLSMYLLMFSFTLMLACVALVVRILHYRPALSLVGPVAFALPQFATVTIMLAIISVPLFALAMLGVGGPFVPNLTAGTWILMLPLSLLAVLIQVAAEEVVFRGYLQQQLAARFRSPLVWMILPSLVFAVGHYQPEAAGENAAIIMIWAGVFGVLMADLTARAGSLGPAIAVHFFNNVLAILVISLPDGLSGLALYLTSFGLEDTEAIRAWLPVDFAQMIVFWLAARLALRR